LNVTCDQCQRRYVVPDEKLTPGKPLKIRCKNCQAVITVNAPAAAAANPWEDEATRAAPALDRNAKWFTLVDDEQEGPYSVEQLESRIRSGQLALDTMIWREGQADWQPAQEVPELIPLFAGVRVSRPEPKPEPKAEPKPAPKAEAAKRVSKTEVPKVVVAPEASPEKREPVKAGPVLAERPRTQSGLHELFDDVDAEATHVRPSRSKLKPLPKPGSQDEVPAEDEAAPAKPRRSVGRIAIFVFALLVIAGAAYIGNQLVRATSTGPAVPAKPDKISYPTRTRVTPVDASQIEKQLAAQLVPTVRAPVREGAPAPDALKKVFDQNRPAFRECMEQDLAKTDLPRGGKVRLTATVAGTGKVTGVEIDRRDVETTELGTCLKGKAQQMDFGNFGGAPVQIDIPLILTTAL
jgi:predicted Zn finger-like uncharacterized protein